MVRRRIRVRNLHPSRRQHMRGQLHPRHVSAYYQPESEVDYFLHPLVLQTPNDSVEHYVLLDFIAVGKLAAIDLMIDAQMEVVNQMPRGIVRSAHEHNIDNWLGAMRRHARLKQHFIRRRIREQRYARGLQRRFRGRSFVGRLPRVPRRTV